MPSFEWCKDVLLQAIGNIRTLQIDCSDACLDTLEATMVSLELVYREFIAAEMLGSQLRSHDYKALHFIRHAYDILRDVYETGLVTREEEFNTVQSVPVSETHHSGLVGRPTEFVIPRS